LNAKLRLAVLAGTGCVPNINDSCGDHDSSDWNDAPTLRHRALGLVARYLHGAVNGATAQWSRPDESAFHMLLMSGNSLHRTATRTDASANPPGLYSSSEEPFVTCTPRFAPA
jgi:hypothetical protein